MKLLSEKLYLLSFIFIKGKVEYSELIKINKPLVNSLIQDKVLSLSEHYVEDFPISYHRFYKLSYKGIFRLFFNYIFIIFTLFFIYLVYPLISQVFNDYVLTKILSK